MLTFAQESASQSSSSADYQRKSISYIPAVHIPGSEAYEMADEQFEYLIATVKDNVEMKRFDYNRLPEKFTNEFIREVRGERNVTPEGIAGLLDETVKPKILDILDAQKEMRAKELVTEEQRQQFIATKAKASGITADQLETVMNAGYIYIPYVESVNFDVSEGDDSDGTITFSVSGGIIWYHLMTKGTEPQVTLLLTKGTTASGMAEKGVKYGLLNDIPAKEFAFESAVRTFGKNLKVATQSIPAFQLHGEVQYVEDTTVEFDLGSREGIKVDDGFYVKERQQTSDGETALKEVGFVRAVNVADNEEKPHRNTADEVVMGSGFATGMQLYEHPRLPIDLVARMRFFNVQVNEENHSMSGYDLEANYHIGRWMDIPLFYGNLGLSFGGNDTYQTAQLYVGLGKKYFYKRIGLGIFGQYGTSGLSPRDDDADWSLGSAGFTLQTGAEYLLTPNISLGLYGGYQFFSEDSEQLNTFDPSGGMAAFYIHYQPKSLLYNPADLIRLLFRI